MNNICSNSIVVDGGVLLLYYYYYYSTTRLLARGESLFDDYFKIPLLFCTVVFTYIPYFHLRGNLYQEADVCKIQTKTGESAVKTIA